MKSRHFFSILISIFESGPTILQTINITDGDQRHIQKTVHIMAYSGSWRSNGDNGDIRKLTANTEELWSLFKKHLTTLAGNDPYRGPQRSDGD